MKLPTFHIEMGPTWESCVATKDTGTKENWISQDIVDRYGLEVERGYLQENITFNGEILSSCERVTATWNLNGSTKSHKCHFRVVATAPFDVLFGRNFLKEYPGVLNSKAASGSPLLVLVQKTKDVCSMNSKKKVNLLSSPQPDEQKRIEENRKKKDKASAALQDGHQKEGNRPSAGARSHNHGSSSKSGRKKGSKSSR